MNKKRIYQANEKHLAIEEANLRDSRVWENSDGTFYVGQPKKTIIKKTTTTARRKPKF